MGLDPTIVIQTDEGTWNIDELQGEIQLLDAYYSVSTAPTNRSVAAPP